MVAKAGTNQNVVTGSTVTLNAGSSSDTNGALLTYAWSFVSKPAGSSATLSDPTAVKPTFVADVDGDYVLQLIVNDGTANSAPATVTITAATANSAPVANAGSDQNVKTGSTVTLDGSGSSDADGDTLTYAWSFVSKPAGSSATLSDSTAVKPTFVADVDGAYVLQLIVNDGTVNSTSAQVTITAATANSAPVASAGSDQNVTTGSTVTLDGSGSSDADGDSLTYVWSFVSKPTGSSAALSDSTAVKPTFVADVDGAYVLQLIVNDGTVNSGPAQVTITASSSLGTVGPWPEFKGNSQRTGLSLVDTSTNSGGLKWKYETALYVESSPVIGADGTIYVGCWDNNLYAINADGSLKWKFDTGTSFLSASAAIGADGTIYVANGANLYAINTDGSLKWKYDMGNPLGTFCSPAIGTDGTIYVSNGIYLYAINADGTQKWKYDTGGGGSPAIGADGTIYVGSIDNSLYAINPDGTLKWKYGTSGEVQPAPAIGADGTIYVGSNDDYLYAINADGSLKWRYPTGGAVTSSAAIGADGTIYVGSDDDNLYAINADGSLKGKFATGGWVQSSPAIGADGTIYVGSDDDYLYAIKADGTLKWKYEALSTVDSSPAIGADGTIYVGSDDSYLYAIGP